MTSRQQISNPKEPDRQLPSGFEGTNIPTDFHIPSCNISDLDKALFNLFDKQIGFQISSKNETKDVPIIFSGGERFANVRPVRKNKPIRDKNGTIILPIIAIRRTNLNQSELSFNGRGIGQDTGDLVIKRRLSSKDPSWQNLRNKALLQNQDNTISQNHFLEEDSPEGSKPGTLATRRFGANSSKQHPTGELLEPNLGDNIFEVITMPFPHFYVAEYEITFWTQYIQHMNELMEKLMISYHAQGNQFKIESDKGYWFVAFFADDISNEDNIADYSNEERILRYTFKVSVPGYLIAPDNSGDMSPFRRYLSAPQINFELCEGDIIELGQEPEVGSGNIDKFILNEVQELDKFGNPVLSKTTKTRLGKRFVRDPFTGEEEVRLSQIVSRNRRNGESVASSLITRPLGSVIL